LSLKIAVVVANEPIPRVSKKFVTKPVATEIADGAEAAPSRARERRSDARNTAP